VIRARLLLVGVLALFGIAPEPSGSRYLFVWAMEVRNPSGMASAYMAQMRNPNEKPMSDAAGFGNDFVAVFDVARDTSPFGKLVAMLPVGPALMAHHTSYALPSDDLLYANDWLANRTYVVDLHDPLHPRLMRTFGNVGEYGYPHSFVHLSNGYTLATFQYSKDFNRAPGGLVEFDAHGNVVKTSSAADTPMDPNIRPYSLAVVKKLDRVVTSSADMMGQQDSHVAQVWRLSDLKLLATIPLPKPPHGYYDPPADSSEPRVLADGTTVVVPTFHCGLFIVHDLASDRPTLQHVYDFGYRTCEVPVVAGNYLVETMQSGHAVASLDMHDPEHPREVSRILLATDEYPHWLALEPNGDRLVITGYGALQTHARFATIDRQTGALTLDPQSIDFTRSWPDGYTGSAIPHGAVFSND
jgi:hypothetical protein